MFCDNFQMRVQIYCYNFFCINWLFFICKYNASICIETGLLVYYIYLLLLSHCGALLLDLLKVFCSSLIKFYVTLVCFCFNFKTHQLK